MKCRDPLSLKGTPVTPILKGDHGDRSPGATPHHGTEEEAIAAALARHKEAESAAHDVITMRSHAETGGSAAGDSDGGGAALDAEAEVDLANLDDGGTTGGSGMKRRYSVERTQIIYAIQNHISDPVRAKQVH